MIAIRSIVAPLNDGARRASQFDHILLVVARVLDEIAYRARVDRRLILERLHDLELVILYLRDADIEHAMMCGRIDGHLSARRIDADTGFERLNNLRAFDGARLLDTLRPEIEALI